MEKSLVTNKPKFSVAIQSETYKKLINNTLGDPQRSKNFVASISSAVAANPSLQECDAGTILMGALVGESLNLDPSPQLGNYYLVPYDNNKKKIKEAQFQMGYKGYIQLAKRSGQYLDIDVTEIREGEYLGRDKYTGKHMFEFIGDDDIREDLPIIGYKASIEELNGFKKTMYWSKAKMEKHAIKYSAGYKADLAKGTKYTYWSKDFDGMAFKTMLRQIISKWGTLSSEMQIAFSKDMSSIHEDGTYDYVDNQEETEIDDVIIEQVEEATPKAETKKVSLDEL